MDYKRKSLRALTLALVTVLCTGFTSCGDGDDSPSVIPPTTPSVPVTGRMECDFVPAEGDLALFDITAEYTDSTGIAKTETVTGEWKKTVTYTKLPVEAKFVIKHTLKPDVEISADEKYRMGYELTYAFYAYDAKGDMVAKRGGTGIPDRFHFNGDQAKIEKWAAKDIVGYSYTISNEAKDGSYMY